MFIINTVLEHSVSLTYLLVFGCAGSSLPHTGFLCSQGTGAAPGCVRRLLTEVVLALQSTGSRSSGCSSWGVMAQMQLAGSRAQTQQLWRTGPAAPRRVGFSQARDQTCVTCISRRIFNSWITREVASTLFLLWKKQGYHCPFGNALHHMEAKWVYF